MKDAILISPPFFHYEDFIKEELEKKGYRVFYLNHRKGKVADALLSFTSIEKRRTLYVNTLMKRLMKLPKGNIELLLVIKGEFLDQSHVEYLKKENSVKEESAEVEEEPSSDDEMSLDELLSKI